MSRFKVMGSAWRMVAAVAAVGLGSGCTLTLDPSLHEESAEGSCEGCRPAIDDSIQLSLLYPGPVGDHGWSKTHDDSRKYVLDQMEEVKARFTPSVAPADAKSVIEKLIAEGDNVIVGASFDFLLAVQNAALTHPDKNFLVVSGFQTGPNLGSYSGRMYQSVYMAGRLAGQMTKSKLVGVVAPLAIPETVRHVNAFAQGVRSVHPDAQILVDWVGDWFDPAVEERITRDLHAAGCDVIFGNTDTTIPVETVDKLSTADSPVFSIGYDNPDSCQFAKDTCLTSVYWNWGPMLMRILEQMQNGLWNPGEVIWEQMRPDPEESSVYLSAMNEALVPSGVRINIEETISELTADTERARNLPFLGPVKDTLGATRVGRGSMPTDTDLLRMCWFVDGVVDLDLKPATVPTQCQGDR